MLRTALVLWMALVASMIACKEGHMVGSAGRGAKPTAWKEITVPGVELFVLVEPGPPHRATGAARVEGSPAMLHAKPAFDAARAKSGDDPTVLATLAMLFLDEHVAGKQPWLRIAGPRAPEQQAIATQPRLSGDTLEYWREHEQTDDLVRCRVSLKEGTVVCELGSGLVHAGRMTADPAGTIDADLQADDIYLRIRGIRALEATGDEPARERLRDLALDQHHYSVRAAATESLGKLRGAGLVETLSRILLHDGHADVRRTAAIALGRHRDPAGREALQRAATADADVTVQVEARKVLDAR
ncbi:MAG: HEAT repeat domain-containing protein [Myxococcota bacterium]|nr:HEAT repeat domain-containing protein [Myxococcota bacterium]